MARQMREKRSTQPLSYPRTNRPRQAQGAGDFWAGTEVLLHSDLAFRDDRGRGSFVATLKLAPMPLPLLNAVNVRARAWFVPHTALQRFPSVEAYIASYNGEPERPDHPVIPLIQTMNSPGYFVGTPPRPTIFNAGGYYAPAGQQVNADLVEAYNAVINYERRAINEALPQRALNDVTVAQATWIDSMFRDAELTFDAARISQEITLPVDGGRPFVSGIGILSSGNFGGISNNQARESDGVVRTYPRDRRTHTEGTGALLVRGRSDTNLRPDIRAELEHLEMRVRLGQLDQARVIARLADVRDRFRDHEQAHLIDDLMAGFSVPPVMLKHPMLLREIRTTFRQQERWATDGDNLDQRQIDTEARLVVDYVVPETTVGGLVLITVTVQPEQLFLGSFDPGVHVLPRDERPDALRDTLDIYKVRPMPNRYVKVDHPTPNGVYGFVPMNHHVALPVRRLGGRYRDVQKEDRAAVWQVSYANPSLNSDGFLCPWEFPADVFADPVAENVTIMWRSQAVFNGLTQFGVPVVEETGSYEALQEAVSDE